VKNQSKQLVVFRVIVIVKRID